MSEPAEILFEERGAIGLITMNRPKALNSLTLDMVVSMREHLLEWENQDAIKAVVIQGAGEKGFCAGGDIRALHDSGKQGTPYALEFFAKEYRNNAVIARYTKPFIAIMDGITMGGGVGVSVHGSFRVVTDRTMLAMPETGIGLIPDVGGTYILSHFPGRLGEYLGLTGARLKAADVLYVGAGTHYVAGDTFDAVLSDLAEASYDDDPFTTAALILDHHAGDAGEPPLAAHREDIDRLFAADRVEDIVAGLAAEESEWAAQQLETLGRMSPTSMKLTRKAIADGRTQSVDDCLKMEFRLVSRIMQAHDFYEGVRAVIIDRDQAPQWNPARLEEVSDSTIESYFASLGDLELDLSNGD